MHYVFVRYGDIVAMNDGERLFSVFVMVMGSTILAYIVGTVSTQAFNKNGGKGLQEQKLSLVRDYLAEQGTPKTLREAVMRHFCFALEKKTAFDELQIWQNLPHSHRQEVVMCVHRATMEKLPLFVKVKDSVMTAIHCYMEPCLSTRLSYVYNFETGSGGVYFILRGTAEVVDEDEDESEVIVAKIRAGMFFGHEKLLGLATDFVGIRSRTDLSMLMISDKNLSLLKLEMPLAYNAFVSLLEEALQIYSKTPEITGPPSDQTGRKSFLRNLSDAAESSVRDLLGLPSHKLLKTKAATQKQKQAIQRHKSSVEEFFEWFSSDMDESTWIKKSNMSHFQKRMNKGLEGVHTSQSPSNVLSLNSKDRFKAMKKEAKLLYNKSESMDSSDGASSVEKARASMLSTSGRHSYADLYGVRSKEKSSVADKGKEGSNWSSGSQHSRESSDLENKPLVPVSEDIENFSNVENSIMDELPEGEGEQIGSGMDVASDCFESTDTIPYNQQDKVSHTIDTGKNSPRRPPPVGDLEMCSFRYGPSPDINRQQSL